MQTAFKSGNLYPSALKRFLELESNWLCKFFMPFQGSLACLDCAWNQKHSPHTQLNSAVTPGHLQRDAHHSEQGTS